MILDPFRPLPPAVRADSIARYLTYLQDRDGDIDRSARRMARREARFSALPVIRSTKPVPPEVWSRAMGPEGAPDDPRLLWLVALARANRNECYAATRVLERGIGHPLPHGVHLLLAEDLHTRMIIHALAMFGVDHQMGPPSRSAALSLDLLERLPTQLRVVVDLAGELTGATLFALLLDGTDRFADEPSVHARLRLLLSELLSDEIGHVVLATLRNSAWGLWAARRLLPNIVDSVCADTPELERLAGGRAAVLQSALQGDLARAPEVAGQVFLPTELRA